ncbi:MAG: 30S ribosomal protein S20 [Candidatus Komeilibacteria bacterium]
MPVKKAAYKDLRQSKKSSVVNLRAKRELKDLAKKIDKALDGDDMTKVAKLAADYQKKIDKAVQTGKVKKNTAARRKSRLAKKIKTRSSK